MTNIILTILLNKLYLSYTYYKLNLKDESIYKLVGRS